MNQAVSTITRHRSFTMVAMQASHFVRHFIEMCLAMCIGVAVFGAAYVWVAEQFGVGDPYLNLPALTAFVLAFNMTLPMVAWMRFRGMAWRPTLEMSAAMFAEAAVLVAAYWLGIIHNVPIGSTTSLWVWQHALMMPVMLVPMLLRLDVYTGTHHHAQVA